MKAQVRLLDQNTSNQIAAGEVVEKPASVVKELVENSLDAGADHIEVTIFEGGTEFIRVRDNGSGMDEANARMAILRHGEWFWGDWMNDVLYGNCITAFLPNMPADHPYVKIYGLRQLVLCVGQGAWEDNGIADLRVIRDNCRAKGIPVWCDFWGNDVNHDWPWWRKQIRYFLPYVLEDMEKTMAAEA